MLFFLHRVILLALSVRFGHGVENRDNWSEVGKLDIYNELDECSKTCVLKVNDKVYDVRQRVTCKSWGCVCSDSDTAGQNYQNARSNVTECAKSSCNNDQGLVEAAEKTFDQLCLIQSLKESGEVKENGTYPRIDGTKYPALGPCEKFLLNGCIDAEGNRKEEDCHPDIYAEGWDQYRGLADSRQCTSMECMCRGESNFTASFDTLLDAGLRYCGLRPSVQENPNKEADDLKIMFAEDCTRSNYPHDNFTWTYSGQKPGSDNKNEMSKSDWIQAILTPLVGLFTVLATGMTGRMWYLMERATPQPKP